MTTTIDLRSRFHEGRQLTLIVTETRPGTFHASRAQVERARHILCGPAPCMCGLSCQGWIVDLMEDGSAYLEREIVLIRD